MTLHADLIKDLIRTVPGTKTHGFRRKTIDAIKRTQGGFWSRQREADYHYDLSFVPDAYSIVDRNVTIYEVVCMSHILKDKLEKIAHAWFSMDCLEWDLHLIVVNQLGVHSETDLCSTWHALFDHLRPKEPEPVKKAKKPEPGQPRGPRSNKVFWWESC